MDEPGRDGQAATEAATAAAGGVAGVGKAPSLVSEPRSSQGLIADGQKKRIAANKEAGVANLTIALRRARLANAERSDALADLRLAELARLEILRDQLAPVFAQVPADCDLFDVGVAPGQRPRLFIDHVAFIEMGRDRRVYRFVQDTRHGRIIVGESENIETVVEAVTQYIAHRLIERERALASDFAGRGAEAFAAEAAGRGSASAGSAESAGARLRRASFRAFLFVVEAIGSALFFGLLGLLGFWLYRSWLAH